MRDKINHERKRFLKDVTNIVMYWENEDLEDDSMEKRLEGVVFSILVLLDGGNIGNQGYKVIPVDLDPESNGDTVDIAGGLHELYYSFLEETKKGDGKNEKKS